MLLKQILNDYKLNIYDENNLKINQNYGTDKGYPKSYIDGFYEENFKKYKEKDITLVEIGVRSGASLKLWSEYFSKNSIIYGLDNQEASDVYFVPVNKEWVSIENVRYIVGDAYTFEICRRIKDIDILIDDGPHSFRSHLKLLDLYASKMKKGGVIVIEDIIYDPRELFGLMSDDMKSRTRLYDFGGGDNKLIVVNF